MGTDQETSSMFRSSFIRTRHSSLQSHPTQGKRQSILKPPTRVMEDIIIRTAPQGDMTSTIVSQCLRDREVVVSLVPDLLLPSIVQEEASPAPRLGNNL